MVSQWATYRDHGTAIDSEWREAHPGNRSSTCGRQPADCPRATFSHVPPFSLKAFFLFRMLICSLQLSRYVSPRRRAQRTLELLGLCCAEKFPWQEERIHADEEIRTKAKVQVTGDIREWDYGDYEGLTSMQIREQRKQRGEAAWDIWRDGCPGGE